MRPRVAHRPGPWSVELGSFFLSGSRAGAPPWGPPVRVLESTQVAGYDASVLAADDPDALAAWLCDHGYAWTRSSRRG